MSSNESEVRQACLRFGLPFASLEENDLPDDLIELVPSTVALHWRVVPIALKGDRLILATDDIVNPTDRIVDASIDLRRRCQPALTSRDALHRALERYYSTES